MADANIKKIIIPKVDLPAVFSNNFSYNIRFRVVSEDKNRISHWSSIYNIDAIDSISGSSNKLQYSYLSEVVKDSNGDNLHSVRFSWIVPPDLGINLFDVFVKRDSLPYIYVATTSSNAYTVFQEAGETHIKVAVQAPTYPKQINSAAYLFETASINI